MNPKLRSYLNGVSRRLINKKVIADFKWSKYTEVDYKKQYKLIMNEHDLLINSPALTHSHKSLEDSNLLPALKFLYSQILLLNPKSVFEVGAGNGINLINLQTLMPDSEILGIELLSSQIELGHETFPNFSKVNIRKGDFLDNKLPVFEKYELVFTNAVVMHLSLNNAKKMIRNLVLASEKYVLMHENIKSSHDYPKILLDLSKQLSFKYEIISVPNSDGGLIKIEVNVH